MTRRQLRRQDARIWTDGLTTVAVAADPLAPCGARLTTLHVTGFWKILLQEVERHRVFSFCVGSSRAIPARKFRRQVIERPFIPLHWGANRPGMQAREELTGWRLDVAVRAWLWLRWVAVFVSWLLDRVGLHKQVANRLLEPWATVDMVVSAPEWSNFLQLRDHPDAQPELRQVAAMIRYALDVSVPVKLEAGQWHTPFVAEGVNPQVTSAARCARASYHQWAAKTYDDDFRLVRQLSAATPKHLSPFEHVAQALEAPERCGNFVGFRQWRADFADEAGGSYG